MCNLLISLRFPEASGGRAAEVKEFVKLRIEQYEAAGLAALDASKARKNLNDGGANLTAGRYTQAYTNFCAAYSVLSAAAK